MPPKNQTDKTKETLAANRREDLDRAQADLAELNKRKKAQAVSLPQLIDSRGVRRCSVCKMPFLAEGKRSLNKAFAEHVLSVHKPSV